MAETTIEWAHFSFNPWRGCTKVSDGCKHCYAETFSKRNPKALGVWGPSGVRAPASDAYWQQPIRWNAEGKAAGERRRVFCASLADVFENSETCHDAASVGVIEEGRARLWELIEATPCLDWLLLTKRPQNILRHTPLLWEAEGFPSHVWVGTSVENQAVADERIRHLLQVPAAVHFLSMEPLLGPVDLTNLSAVRDLSPDYLNCLTGETHCSHGPIPGRKIGWVIAGGESGPNARPMHPQWVREIRDQCQRSGTPFLFKQWGEHIEVPEADAKPGDFYFIARERGTTDGKGRFIGPNKLVFDQYPWKREDPPMKGAEAGRWSPYYDALMRRVGKKAAGRLLDGRTWDEFPEVAT